MKSDSGTLDAFWGEAKSMAESGAKHSPIIGDLLIEIRDNTRTTCVKLFGSTDPDDENDTGRLPKAEKKLDLHARRLDEIVEKVEQGENKNGRLWDRLIVAGLILLFLWDHAEKLKGLISK